MARPAHKLHPPPRDEPDAPVGPVLDLPESITEEHAARVTRAIARLLARVVVAEILEEERAGYRPAMIEGRRRGKRRAPGRQGGP